MSFSEEQIREDLEETIKAAAPLAVVFPWWALGGDERTWPGKLVSKDDQNRVHGYVITPRRTYSVRDNANCTAQYYTYQVRGMHWHETGNREANSDRIHVAELIAICHRFSNKRNLPQSLRHVEKNSNGVELDFRIDLDAYGGELLHKSLSEITFRDS